MPTVKIYASQSAYVDNDHPDTNYSSGDFIYSSGDENKKLFISFGTFEDNEYLFQKNIRSFSINFYGKADKQGRTLIYSIVESWNSKTITFNNTPEIGWSGHEQIVVTNTSGFEWRKYEYSINSTYYETLKRILKYGCALYDYYNLGDQQNLTVYSANSSTYKPYLEITYENWSPDITGYTVSSYPSGYEKHVDELREAVIIPTGYWVPVGMIDGDNFGVASVRLGYKPMGSMEAYTYITTPDSNFGTIPANTLNGDKYDLEIQCTYTNGELSNSYVDVLYTYKNIDIWIFDAYQIDGFIDREKNQEFGWTVKPFINALKQQSYTYQWRLQGSSDVTTISQETNLEYYILPKNTIPSSATGYEWRVNITNNRGKTTGWSDWYSLTTDDAIPTCTAESPKSVYVYGDGQNLFTWIHDAPNGTRQTKAELQYKKDGTEIWIDFISTTDRLWKVEVPPNTLPAGKLQWRVRTYNLDNEPSEWSAPLNIIVIAKPAKPIISSVGKSPRIMVTWQSSEQQAYQVKIGDLDSGAIFGTEKSYISSKIFADGSYEVAVRVQNSSGKWSDWATATATVSNTPTGEILLTGQPINFGVSLEWVSSTEYVVFQVLRDNVVINTTTSLFYNDYLSNGAHSYKIQGILADGNYTDSNSILETTKVKYAALSSLEEMDWIALRGRIKSNPSHTQTTEKPINYVFLSGRTKPFAEISEFLQVPHTFTFTLTKKEDYEKLLSLLGKLVVFKDTYGYITVGVLDSVSADLSRYIDVSFSIMEVDKFGILS